MLGGDIIVAQPFNDRYPPHTRAVDRSARGRHTCVQAGVEAFRNWLAALGVAAREHAVGRVPGLLRLHAAARGRPAGPFGLDRPRERRGAATPRA